MRELQTTKQQILALLKRTGSVTVEEAACALAVASMTARQHLVGLERDGLIQTERVRRSTGRPHYLFTLTSKGDETFPRRYDLLAQIILDEVAAIDVGDIAALAPAKRRTLLVRRTADRIADRYRFQVEGRSLAERVAAVTDVLHLVGGFAEWLTTPTGFEIRDYNCAFARLVPETNNGCEWHIRLLNQLLKWPVHHEHMVEGRVQCCRYLIEAVPTALDA